MDWIWGYFLFFASGFASAKFIEYSIDRLKMPHRRRCDYKGCTFGIKANSKDFVQQTMTDHRREHIQQTIPEQRQGE